MLKILKIMEVGAVASVVAMGAAIGAARAEQPGFIGGGIATAVQAPGGADISDMPSGGRAGEATGNPAFEPGVGTFQEPSKLDDGGGDALMMSTDDGGGKGGHRKRK